MAEVKEQPEFLKLNMNDPSNVLYQENGRYYFNGKPFNGLAYTLFPAGDTITSMTYVNGREDGVYRKYHSNRKLAEERFYKAGKKTGIHRAWYEDGKNKFEYHFKNGEHEGVAIEWYSTGIAYRKFNYINGQESGRQQMWWPDGSVRANYVVKNGEQFGLIGRKLCVNPYHEQD